MRFGSWVLRDGDCAVKVLGIDNITAVPEPGTIGLLSAGLILLAGRRILKA
jgi:hypothetical protein